jgi:hypothetical protein
MSKEVVRHAIRNTISRYQENQYFNIREADYCSEIVSAIRDSLRVKSVSANIYAKNQGTTLVQLNKFDVFTSRVHQEASFPHTKDAVWDGSKVEGKLDIILLKEEKVSLSVSSPSLERDTWAQYRLEDIESVIEVKCTPLHSGDIEDIMKDLEKLKTLGQNGVKDLHFVQINTGVKSLFDVLKVIDQNIFSTRKPQHHTGEIKIWASDAQLNPNVEDGAEAYDVSGGAPLNPKTVYF